MITAFMEICKDAWGGDMATFSIAFFPVMALDSANGWDKWKDFRIMFSWIPKIAFVCFLHVILCFFGSLDNIHALYITIPGGNALAYHFLEGVRHEISVYMQRFS